MGQNVFHHVNRAPIRTKHIQKTLLLEIITLKKIWLKRMPVNNVPMGGWCHELASSASVGAMGGREVGGGRSTVHGRWEVHRAGAPSMAETSPPGRSA